MEKLFEITIADQIKTTGYVEAAGIEHSLIVQFDQCSRHPADTLDTAAFNAIAGVPYGPDTLIPTLFEETPFSHYSGVTQADPPFQASFTFDTRDGAKEAADRVVETLVGLHNDAAAEGLENVLPEQPERAGFVGRKPRVGPWHSLN